MQITEELLWRYIDGDCSPAERRAVDQRLVRDESVREEYASLLAYHARFTDLLRKRANNGGDARPAADLPEATVTPLDRLSSHYDLFGSARSN